MGRKSLKTYTKRIGKTQHEDCLYYGYGRIHVHQLQKMDSKPTGDQHPNKRDIIISAKEKDKS